MRLLRAARAISALTLLCCAAAGAAPKVEFVHGYPLGHAYVEKQWTMVMVRIKNTGDQAVDVNVIVSEHSDLRTVQYVRPLFLPAHCERIGWFYGQFLGGRTYSVTVKDKATRAELSKGDLWSNVLPYSRLFVLAADRERLLPAFDIYLSHREAYKVKTEEEKDLRGGTGTQVPQWYSAGEVRRPATIYMSPPAFPDHWAGWDSMNAAAFGELDYHQFRPSQVSALINWIESGGVVLLFPGPKFESLQGSGLEPLLPVRLFGARKLKHVPLERGTAKWVVEMEDYVDIVEAEAKDGEVLLSGGEFPMVVRKKMGMGAVYFFAFPGGVLDKWVQRGTFLAQVLRTSERLKPLAQTRLLSEGPKMLDEVTGAKVAPASFVVFALGGFFILAAIALIVTFVMGRGEFSWAVIIPVGVIVAIVSYKVGVKYGERVGLSLNEIAVLSTSSGGTVAFRSAVLGVHTMESFDGELVARNADTLFASSAGEEKQGGEVTTEVFSTSPQFRLIEMRVPARSFPRYLTDSVVKLGGPVTAEFRLGKTGLTGKVTNSSGMLLKDCLVACNSYPYVLGDLPAGESIESSLTDENVGDRGSFVGKAILGDLQVTRKAIITNLFLPVREFAFTPWARRVFLLGWPKKSFISEDLKGAAGKPAERSESLLCVEMNVAPAPAGSDVVVPKAFNCVAIRRGGAGPVMSLPPPTAPSAKEGAVISSALMGPTEVHVFLPPFAWNVAVSEAEVALNARAYGFDLVVMGTDRRTGEKVQLARYSSVDGKKSFVIKDADRFYDPNRGAVIFVIDAVYSADKSLPTAAGWDLKDMGVTLKGKAH